MRITFVLPYAGLSGGIRVVGIYARLLQKRGHQVTIVSTQWTPPGVRGKAWHIIRRWLHSISQREDFADPSHLDGLRDVEHRIIRQNRAVVDADVPDGDVVIATWWETAPWVMNLSHRKGAKAYFVQDYGAHDGQPMSEITPTWRLPMHKIAISKYLLRLIESNCADRDIDYVPNAVDAQQFNAPTRTKQPHPTVGFLYSSAPQKGCDVMIEAIRLARQRVPGLRVLSYGPGDPEPELPLPEDTQFWRYAAEDVLRDIYGACDMWLFGSRLEGFGLPILEAMACRTPVIATTAGAAPELLETGGGVLVNVDDPQAMADAIVRIAGLTEDDWRAMSDAAHATATGYSWEDATDAFEAALHRAIAKSNAHHIETTNLVAL